MGSKILNVLCIVILVVVNAFMLYKYSECKKKLEKSIKSINSFARLNIKTDREILAYKANFEYNIRNRSEICANEFVDSTGNKIFIPKKYNVFCRISDTYCSSCNNYVLGLIKALDYDIAVVINRTNKRSFVNAQKTYKLYDKEIFGCDNLNIAAEKLNFPYIFITNGSNEIKSIYIPFEENTEGDISNLKFILENLCMKI